VTVANTRWPASRRTAVTPLAAFSGPSSVARGIGAPPPARTAHNWTWVNDLYAHETLQVTRATRLPSQRERWERSLSLHAAPGGSRASEAVAEALWCAAAGGAATPTSSRARIDARRRETVIGCLCR
jgi:hypothetical protein